MFRSKRYWMISGWDSARKLSEFKLPYESMGERQVSNLLQTLTAKHALTDDEVVGSCVKRRSDAYLGLLEVTAFCHPYSLSCGQNPSFTARVIDE